MLKGLKAKHHENCATSVRKDGYLRREARRGIGVLRNLKKNFLKILLFAKNGRGGGGIYPPINFQGVGGTTTVSCFIIFAQF
jgi:hypothetical protein